MSMDGAEPTRVIVVGCGAIGSTALAECRAHDGFVVVGAVDPARAGERVAGVEIQPSLGSVPDGADVAMLCTASQLSAVQADLETLVAAGFDVASTCEELTLPWLTDPEIAEQIDASARAVGRTILGCGVNPGLVMDVLPVVLASASLGQRSVTVRRLVDLERRRTQLRSKLGIGRAAAEWNEIQAREAGAFGHFGLVESARLLALGLDWPVESTDFTRRPLVRDDVVTGVQEVVRLGVDAERRIELELVFELGGEDVDEILIDGEPALELVARGGIHGDTATVARLLAAARVVGDMPAGLRLPLEAPPRAIKEPQHLLGVVA